MDRLTSMAAFVKAAESGSFAATTSALGISPQMVAKHVTYLEARLGLGAIELAPFQTIACGSPAYLKERGMPSTVSDLPSHECVLFGNWAEPTFSDWLFVRDGLISKAAVHGRLKVNSPASLLQAALAGFGLALLGEESVRSHLAIGRLVRVLPNYETPAHPIHLLFHPDRRQTPKLKSFIEMVVEQLGRSSHFSSSL